MARNFLNKCICSLCAVSIIFVSPVHASALPYLGSITAAAEAGKTVGELFGNVLEDFFGLQHQCTLTEATLITINRSLDAIFSNTYGYDIVNPYSGSSGTYHRSNATFGDMLADMNNSIATLGIRYLSTLVTNSNGISSLVTDIKTNTANSAASNLASLTFLGSIEDSLKHIDWQPLSYNPSYFDSSFNQITYHSYTQLGTDVYISAPASTNLSNGIIHLTLPISYLSNTSYLKVEFSYYRYATFNYDYFYIIPSMYQVDIYFIAPMYVANSTYIHLYNELGLRFVDGVATAEYILPDNARYLEYLQLLNDRIYHQETIDTLQNLELTATIDGDVIVDINDSINVTPIELDVQIGINDFTEVNTISNKLRSWLSTGVGVSALIGALDQLDDSFFTLHNRSVIETINAGYTDFYD